MKRGKWLRESTVFKAVTGDLPDVSVLRVAEVYAGFKKDVAPMITTMDMSPGIPLVDSAFGKVQAGSVLSYQQPAKKSPHITRHKDAPPPPLLPLKDYHLEQSQCTFVPSEQEMLHLISLAVTPEIANQIEKATRSQSSSREWHELRKPRVTASRFREICHVRGWSSAENLAQRILKGTHQTADMRRGLAMETAAVEEYCGLRNVNFSPCGFLVHPDAPWLGASPDGLIYDPREYPPYGLVEVKCPNIRSYVDCTYLGAMNGTLALKHQHAYYWQIQGQLLISGLKWCDLRPIHTLR
ncbi:uncharacterized protein LOC143480599 [Brachyhypopomus gauderio]|uniref:uncharacterized protein LOC143480599 n=1 Tax=Brachyhypopomus gauderio TaxID=698409 RepID=UPI0040434148